MDDNQPGIGHNQPPVTLDPEQIRSALTLRYADLLDRAGALLAGFARWTEAHGKGIADEDVQAKSADFVRQMKTEIAAADKLRVGEKRPYDDAAAAAHAFFKGPIIDTLTKAVMVVEGQMTAYAIRKQNEERERLRREAQERQRQADEEARVAAEARRKAEAAALAAQPEAEVAPIVAELPEERAADKASDVALVAERKAEQTSAAALSRTRGDLGAVSSLRTVMDYEVEDIHAVPAAYLMVNDRVVRAAIGGKAGLKVIPGLRIFEKQSIQTR